MVSGILAVAKPAGPTSARVVTQVRHLLKLHRLGHSGTLDPAADGVLVMACNRATVLLPYLPAVKTYIAVAVLGRTTETLDAQGRILSDRPVPELSRGEVESALAQFLGDILQVPPLVSALWHQGRRLYALAREGQTVVRPSRPVKIYEIRLLDMQLPRVTFTVTCSGGTYVRSLAADLGDKFGCGAHLAQLSRTASNGYTLSEALSLEELAVRVKDGTWLDRLISPVRALDHFPAITVTEAQARSVRHGCSLPTDAEWNTPVRVLDPQGDLLAVARSRAGRLCMERVLQPEPEEPCA